MPNFEKDGFNISLYALKKLTIRISDTVGSSASEKKMAQLFSNDALTQFLLLSLFEKQSHFLPYICAFTLIQLVVC